MMRIATWNINGLRARLGFMRHWLRLRKPDIVGFQELKVDEGKFPYSVFKEEGYWSVVEAQKAWNGVAILSRCEPQIQQKGLPGQKEMGARFIEARIGKLTFITIYCPNGKHIGHLDYRRKLSWICALLTYLKDRHSPTEPLILCGDFNICPASLDSFNEERLEGQIFHSKEERKLFSELLSWGLVDLFREIYPDQKSFTWWDYRAGSFHRNHGLRIDFLLGTKSVLAGVEHVTIDREYRKKKEGMIASDHAPVYADLIL